MKVYQGSDIRNIGIVGHRDCGKTSVLASLLYTAGATNRFTSVDEGNTVTDFDEEEINRKVTITSSLAFVEWNKTKINFIDTPGYNIFINDAQAALIAAGTALVVVDAVGGAEVQTEKVWSFAKEYGQARVVLLNKMDRERADFSRALADVQAVLSEKAVAVQLPIGSEKDFRGVVDLVHEKAYLYEPDGDGKGKETDIPAEMAPDVESARESLIEAIADCDDDLLAEYLENLTLPQEKVLTGLAKGILDQKIFPVMCMSAVHNIGSGALLDFLQAFSPAPTVRNEFQAEGGVSRKMSDSEPLSLFVYKTAADAFAGRVSYFKVVSGVLHNDDHVQNYTRNTEERVSRVSLVFGKELRPVSTVHAGDLAAVAKLKETFTGDSLGDKAHPISYPKAVTPAPAIAYAIEPKTRHDEDRLGQSIHRILEEDPGLTFYRDPQTKEFLLGGNGQQHLEIVVSKLKKRYQVDVDLHAPKIPYRETIRGRADVQGRHKKQTGGHGQFGDCKIKVEPLGRGKKFEFSNEIFGGAIPKTYIPAVEKGILEASEKGVLAGFPVVDFKVILYDGSYHDVDSSELAFKLAGRKAFRAAMQQAKPALLEPIMHVEIIAPMDFAGDLMGDLNSRRGRIQGMETRGANQIIRAEVPMAEMLTYANDLTSMTQGRGTFTMEMANYDFVPSQFAEKVIAAAKAGGAGVEEDEE